MGLILIFSWIWVPTTIAQTKKKPKENVRYSENKIDSIPYFIYNKIDLDSFIIKNKLMRSGDEKFGASFECIVSFCVDTSLKIYDIKNEYFELFTPKSVQLKDYDYYDSIKIYYNNESLRILNLTTGLWISNKTNYRKKIYWKISYTTEVHITNTLVGNNIKVEGKIKSIFNRLHYYNNGVIEMEKERLLLAKIYFEQALEINPKDIDSYYNLGICYYKLKKNEQACKSWNMAKKYGDNQVQTLLNKYCYSNIQEQ